MDEPLLGAVVEVADDAAAGLVGGGEEARPRGDELVAAVGVGDRGRDQLGELGRCAPRCPRAAISSRVQYTTATPQSRPSTMIGAPTLERTPDRDDAAMKPVRRRRSAPSAPAGRSADLGRHALAVVR